MTLYFEAFVDHWLKSIFQNAQKTEKETGPKAYLEDLQFDEWFSSLCDFLFLIAELKMKLTTVGFKQILTLKPCQSLFQMNIKLRSVIASKCELS